MPLPSSIIMTKPSCKSEPAAPLLNHRPFTLSPLWEKKEGLLFSIRKAHITLSMFVDSLFLFHVCGRQHMLLCFQCYEFHVALSIPCSIVLQEDGQRKVQVTSKYLYQLLVQQNIFMLFSLIGHGDHIIDCFGTHDH